MDTYIEFCIRFWEATRELDLYSMDGSQLDRIIVDALLKTNGGKELIKTSTNELSVLIKAINHNNRKIQQPSLPDNLDEAAEETAQKYYCSCLEKHNETGICDGCENIKQSFKAGAEWMAGQGYKQTERVYNFNGENIPCVSPVIYLPKEFEIGDKVIVHVRKK